MTGLQRQGVVCGALMQGTHAQRHCGNGSCTGLIIYFQLFAKLHSKTVLLIWDFSPCATSAVLQWVGNEMEEPDMGERVSQRKATF